MDYGPAEGLSSLFAAEADALLEFIAEQLPDPSPELAVCRFEQLTLRANDAASSFTAPDRPLFELRAHRSAGTPMRAWVLFHGEPDMILNALLASKAAAGLFTRGDASVGRAGIEARVPHCLPARAGVMEQAGRPMVSTALQQDRCSRDAIETMLHVGALEFA